MIRRAVIALTLVVSACQKADITSPVNENSDKPQRIISLDLCADQYALKFADRDQILALSPEAKLNISSMRAAADGLPTVRPLAENILVLQPDLVIRSYGGGPNIEHILEDAGIPVLTLGWAPDVETVMQVIETTANGLGASEEGKTVTKQMRQRLANLRRTEPTRKVFYMTVSGYTTGPGTLIDDMFLKAGHQNFNQTPGWRSLPLEDLTHDTPDLIALGYHESLGTHTDTWSATRNPIAQDLLKEKPVVKLDGATLSCPDWTIVDAIEALATGASK